MLALPPGVRPAAGLPSACPEDLFGHGRAPSPLGRGQGVRVRAPASQTLGTLTLPLSQREREHWSTANQVCCFYTSASAAPATVLHHPVGTVRG